MSRTFTDNEKYAEILQMIRDMKVAKMHGRTLDILCAVAVDMAARTPKESIKAIETLDKKIAYCVQTKTALGYDQRALAHLGQYVMGFWLTLRAALAESVERSAGENHEDDRLRTHTEAK